MVWTYKRQEVVSDHGFFLKKKMVSLRASDVADTHQLDDLRGETGRLLHSAVLKIEADQILRVV